MLAPIKTFATAQILAAASHPFTGTIQQTKMINRTKCRAKEVWVTHLQVHIRVGLSNTCARTPNKHAHVCKK